MTKRPWPQRCPWCAELSIAYVIERRRVECARPSCGWNDQKPRHRGIRDVPVGEAQTCE